jgi:alkylation response protein AidB-like acyl-CoA dehydrogenase
MDMAAASGSSAAEQDAMLQVVHQFVERDVIPHVRHYDLADEYPEGPVERMRDLGLFGIMIATEYGGLDLGLEMYAQVITELSRGWISISGVLNTHVMAAYMIQTFGTDFQRERYLPRMATGELRAAYSMTEPHAGSDVQAIRTRATRSGETFILNGQKMWVTNGLRAGLVMTLAVTDPDASPRHHGMTAFIVEKPAGQASSPGLQVPGKLKKLGYRGVETTELIFDGLVVREDQVLGGADAVGHGFKQFMSAIEIGRINVGARGVGVAKAAFERAMAYALEREAFGKPIAEHEAIQLKLAQMATKLRAAELLVADAARLKASGERADLAAGMAKLFASETAADLALEAMRIHGGYGYSQEYPVERLYRDAPLLLVGEGTNEIQQILIARRLAEQYSNR